MYSLYAPHPISINPFKTVLFSTFLQEKEVAVRTSGDGKENTTCENEKLVWALWKILKGEGNDVSNLITTHSDLLTRAYSLTLIHPKP